MRPIRTTVLHWLCRARSRNKEPEVVERYRGAILVEVRRILYRVITFVTGRRHLDTVTLLRHCTHVPKPSVFNKLRHKVKKHFADVFLFVCTYNY